MPPTPWRTAALSLALACATTASQSAPVSVLFVGNSYTFGRLDPVLTYNAAQVRDLTQPQGALHGGNNPAQAFTTGAPFTNLTGTNSYPVGTVNPATGAEFTSYSPHSQSVGWGGVPGIFKQFTVQAGLDYDVALSTRNAASLRGHFLNTANANWDLRGNIGSQRWDQVVLQEQSDEALPALTVGGVALGSNYPAFQAYADLVEDWLHQGGALSYRERALYTAIHGSVANCVAAGGTSSSCDNNTLRTIAANANASAATQVYLMQAWARPNLVNPPGVATIEPRSGNAVYDTSQPGRSYYASLQAQTNDLSAAFQRALDFADDDGSGGFAGIVPVGQAFQRAVNTGVATADMYAANALSDGLLDLWFNDGTHASVAGAYLSALTLFGSLTGLDPASLGAQEVAARELGLSGLEAQLLQRVASDQLGFAAAAVPEPAALAPLALALCAWAGARARRRVGVQHPGAGLAQA